MSLNTLSAHQGADTTDAQPSTVADELPTGAERLGIDSEGRIHYWSQPDQTVIVVEPTDTDSARIAHIDVTPGRQFAQYVGHADEIVGWDSLQYDEGGILAKLGEVEV